ncbi:MAG: hypothetical protein LUH07_15335 [Lachnospiraceae bacterium]|nr:hypothetical protein [Lachnospiraceae bacterium]
MEGNKRVYSKPDLNVMYYTPSDAVMACTYTASGSGACLIGGQDTSEGFPTGTTYYIVSGYIIWSYNYGTAPDTSKQEEYEDQIKSLYYSATGNTLSSTMGWHIATYSAAGWSGNAS